MKAVNQSILMEFGLFISEREQLATARLAWSNKRWQAAVNTSSIRGINGIISLCGTYPTEFMAHIKIDLDLLPLLSVKSSDWLLVNCRVLNKNIRTRKLLQKLLLFTYLLMNKVITAYTFFMLPSSRE